MDKIIVKGAKDHNLKNISVELPKNKLVVFTGVSGSGKSTLAFDTIYAEGQRRYVESLSSYARQFLGIMGKPDVDSIEGLSPAISIDQKSTSHNPRSTVGTVTEIYDYLRLLFARVGHPHCSNCKREISRMDKEQITTSVLKVMRNIVFESRGKKPSRFFILSPVVRDRKGEFSDLLNNLSVKGFTTARIDNKIIDLSNEIILIKTNKHSIESVMDRLTVSKKMFKDKISEANLLSRLREKIEQALDLSDGLVLLSHIQDASFSFPKKPKSMIDHLFSERLSCPYCNISLSEIEPRIFSFNSPHGACPTCKGMGSILRVNARLVINPNLSILEGGILPFANQFANDTWYARLVIKAVKEHGIDPKAPLRELNKPQLKVLLEGTGKRAYRVEGFNRFGKMTEIYETFSGITVDLTKKYQHTSSEWVRGEIEKYMKQEVCEDCGGTRLQKHARTITIKGQSIVEVVEQSVKQSRSFISSLEKNGSLSAREQIIARPIFKEVKKRLDFLSSVGLDYLTLSRSATTLAGGEAQRIRLASQIGSGLSGVLYVLDEPSVGLHPRDNQRLINTLVKLRNLGNTVLVVEHDRDMIESADHIVDFGPFGGKRGGKIVVQGTVNDIKKNKKSLTGAFLSGRKDVQVEKSPSRTTSQSLTLKGARQFNLKRIDVSFPLGKFICVTGVSGSGKSTLVVETLYKALKLHFNRYARITPGAHEKLIGAEYIKRVHLIDQSPIGRTPRSNPATYVGAFTYIRTLFSRLKESKAKGFGPGRFSFNVKGGRCENCEGQGQEKIEMQFLPPVWVTCEVCNGARYNAATLDVTFKGKSISDVLHMTVSEGLEIFKHVQGLETKLRMLNDVGLDYIQLGQSAPTLSGGEAQRVKLAAELSKKSSTDNLYILDEPTTGLHFADLEKLLLVLRKLVEAGNTVLVIEHNLEVIKNADYVIDLGPEGGTDGGEIVAKGTPQDIALIKSSYTGQFLARVI